MVPFGRRGRRGDRVPVTVAPDRPAGGLPPMNTNSLGFTVFLGLLAALPALSIDISAPTLPLLPRMLGTSMLVAGLTLSLFMGGFALGQLAGGTLSDRHGRKPILLAGFLIYSAAGLACALASSGPGMVASRFVQGLGAGTCATLSFAMVQDLFQGAVARTKRAYVTVVLGAAPIMAPAMGSVIIGYAGWRAVHAILAAGGVGLLSVTWFWLAESHPVRQLPAARPDRPAPLLRDRRFGALALVNALSYGAAFAYIAGSPVVVIGYYGGSPRGYAALFACTAIALTAGAWTGGRLGRRGVAAEKLVSVALAASAAACLGLAAACLAPPAVSGPVAACLLAFVQFCRGVISPNLQHLAVERQRDRAGAASAVVGVSQLLGGALSSVAVAALASAFGPFSVAGPMAFCGTAALAAWWWTVRPGSSL